MAETTTDHSPLPWRWTPCELDYKDQPIVGAQLYRTDKPHASIFTVDCGDFYGLSDADARFIVTACNVHDDMLAALKHVRAWLCDGGPIQDDGITHPLFVKANNAVHAAIAKAEGR